jgi:hypothetical protein
MVTVILKVVEMTLKISNMGGILPKNNAYVDNDHE